MTIAFTKTHPRAAILASDEVLRERVALAVNMLRLIQADAASAPAVVKRVLTPAVKAVEALEAALKH